MALNYFNEIKNRVFLVIGMWLCLIFTSYYNKETLLFLFIQPWLTISSNNAVYFISTNLTELFDCYINISYFISNQTLIIYSLYHIIIFLAPSFYYKEYKIIRYKYKLFIKLSILFVYIFNKLLIPCIFNFFIKFQKILNGKIFTLYYEAKINEYIYLYFVIYKWCYLIFFIIIFTLFINNYFIKTNNFNFIKYSRKYLYLFFITMSTLFSPPEISFQLLVSLYFIIIYEMTIVNIIFKKIKHQILIR